MDEAKISNDVVSAALISAEDGDTPHDFGNEWITLLAAEYDDLVAERDQALKDRDEARAKIAAKVRRQADLEHEYRDGTNYSYGWQDAAAWIEGGFDHGTRAEFSRATSPAARSTLDSLLQLRDAAEAWRQNGSDPDVLALIAAVDVLTQDGTDG